MDKQIKNQKSVIENKEEDIKLLTHKLAEI